LDKASGKPLVPGWKRKSVGNVECLMVGVVSPTAYMFLPEDTLEKMDIQDPIEAVKRVLSQEKKDGDLIIVLSHMGLEEDRRLARLVPDIHVIVGGHSQNKLEEPVREGNVLIVQAGKNSEYLGVLHLELEDRRQPSGVNIHTYRHRLMVIDDSIQGDHELEAMASEYENTLKQVNVWSGDLAKPYEASRCRTCHASAFEVWAHSRHAHALESIHHDRRARTKDCLSCHTTVIHEPTIREGKEIPMKVVANVQCLACHRVNFPEGSSMHELPVKAVGFGLSHTKDFCMKCHTMKDSPNFVFEKYWEKIKHGR